MLMQSHMPSMNSLRAFEAAARLGGFSLAAEELLLSPSTVSYRISKLEDDIGVLLFRRVTRGIELTDEGTALLVDVKAALSLLKTSIDRFGRAGKKSLVVTLSTYLASRWLSPNLVQWAANNPSIGIELRHDFKEALSDSDIIIHWSKRATFKSKGTLLFPTEMSVHCMPEIAAKLASPADILKFPLLSAETHMDPWPEWMQEARLSDYSSSNFITMTDSNVRIQAAVDGVGIVLANQLVKDELAEGKLVCPFDISVKGPGFYCQNRSNSPELADHFINWLRSLAVTAG